MTATSTKQRRARSATALATIPAPAPASEFTRRLCTDGTWYTTTGHFPEIFAPIPAPLAFNLINTSAGIALTTGRNIDVAAAKVQMTEQIRLMGLDPAGFSPFEEISGGTKLYTYHVEMKIRYDRAGHIAHTDPDA